MAPLPPSLKKPSARTLRQQRIAGKIHPLTPAKTFRPGAAVSDDFLSSKRDKRLIKHSSFVSRIATTASSRVSKPRRTRRPGNKLSTNLAGLAAALPDLEDGEGGLEVLDGKIRHKSLKSKKGALKRKEKVVRGEMERFGVSMAKLAETPEGFGAAAGGRAAMEMDSTPTGDAAASTSAQPAATANRWAALRGYISSTMEQNPAFVGKD